MTTDDSPSIYIPDCWDDDIRMNSLFSVFRPQSLNPQGWADKMNFWKNLVMEYCSAKKAVTFSCSDLCRVFERKGRRPQCLVSVLEEMRRDGILTLAKDFTLKESEQSLIKWGYDLLVKRPLSWGWSYMQNAVVGKSQIDEMFINIPVIKELADNVLSRHKKLVTSHEIGFAVVVSDLYEHCKDICLDSSAFKLVLMQLQKDGQVRIFSEGNQEIVKFKESANEEIKSVSETDLVEFRLQKTKDLLEEEVKLVECEMNRALSEASVAFRKGEKTKAIIFMKKKKRIESLMQKKIGCLENIESLQDKLQETKSEKLVLNTYQAATQALKQLLDRDLSFGKLDATLADLEEALDMKSEVDDVLARPFTTHFNPDMEELEAELQEILKSDHSSTEMHKESQPSPSTGLINILDSSKSEKDRTGSEKVSRSSHDHPMKVAQLAV